VQLIGNIGHPIREFIQVLFEEAFFVSSSRPTVVQHNIIITDISQAGVNKFVRCVKKEGFGDIAAK
jgi:hypothetical protein